MIHKEKNRHVFSARSKVGEIEFAKNKFRGTLVFFTLAILTPITLLLHHVYKKLEKESFYQYQSLAKDLSERATDRLTELFAPEEVRPFNDYNFFSIGIGGVASSRKDTHSPISKFPPASYIPGVVGFFQMNDDGSFHSPVWPEVQMTSHNAAPKEQKELKSDGNFDELNSVQNYATTFSPYESQNRMSIWNRLYASVSNVPFIPNERSSATYKLISHDSSLHETRGYPLQAFYLDTGEIAFVRFIWRGTERTVQGFVVDTPKFFEGVLRSSFRRLTLAGEIEANISLKGKLLQNFRYNLSSHKFVKEPANQEKTHQSPQRLLHQHELAPVLSDFQLLLTLPTLPKNASKDLVTQLAIALIAIVLCGMLTIYHLGIRNLEVAQERSNFVSAVTHELKSPLTSIRMYGEMLRSGWVADEDKRQSYYDFIFYESERLSRLIGNILHLVGLSNNGVAAEIKDYNVHELMDTLMTTIDTQVEYAGFALNVKHGAVNSNEEVIVMVDIDAFTRIFVNLVDNALKFSKEAEKKVVEVGYRLEKSRGTGETLLFFVRDYGPGVAPEQRKKIFDLFYRGEQELIRTTPGTGIGLALVKELAEKMSAEVTLVDHDVGVEFQVQFHAKEGAF